jgi:Protein of unknown function (DUF2905)
VSRESVYARPSASSRTPGKHTPIVSVNAIAANRFASRGRRRNDSLRTFAQDNKTSRYTVAMNRTLIVIGLLVALVGVLWKPLSALPLFRLPGDFVIDRPGFRFFFPLTTMILVSLIVSLILWLFRR